MGAPRGRLCFRSPGRCDMADPRQPSDETPLVSEAESTGAADLRSATDATPPEAPPHVPAVETAIAEVGTAAARHYDNSYTTITDIITGVSDTISGSAARATRTLTAVTNKVDKVVGDERNAAASIGVPIPWGSGATAAELADPTGLPIVRAVQAVMTDAAETREKPIDNPNQGSGCGWRFERGTWTAFAPPGEPMPATDTMPWWKDVSEGSVWFTACAAPPPAVPTAPPPPPPEPNPEPGAECGYWSVGWDQQDPQLLCTRPSPRDLSVQSHAFYWVVWYAPELPDRLTAYQATHPHPILPPGAVVYDQLTPDPAWLVVAAGNPCPPEPVAPPPPPPPVVPPPPPVEPVPSAGVCCPPQTVYVTLPPPALPPAPPPAPPPPVVKPDPTSPAPPPVPPAAPTPRPVGSQDGPGGVANINWDSPAGCGTADRVSEGEWRSADAAEKPTEAPAWLSWVKNPGVPAAWWIPGATTFFTEVLGTLAEKPGRLNELGVDAVVGSSLFQSAIGLIPGAANPNRDAGIALAGRLGLVGRAEELLKVPLSYMFQSSVYAYQYANPQYIPSQDNVDQLYLRNKITAGYWECLTKANGNLPTLHSLLLDAKAVKPIASEIIQLRLRDVIKSDEEYVRRMREVGVVVPAHAMEFKSLASWVPPPTDLMRFMIREAFDEKVVEKYQYDYEFDQRFQGRVKEWAAAQGMTEDQFRYEWRSHWHLPSPTQLYEFQHRLSPDRLEYREWERAKVVGATVPGWLDANPEPVTVTREQVREALIVQDIAPGWVDALMATSAHPLTHTDARRAFMVGYFNRHQLKDAMMMLRYTDRDAETLTRFYETERNKQIGASTGVMSARAILKAYRDGEVSRLDAFGLLKDTLPDADVRSYQLDLAERQVRMETNRLSIAAVRKGYVYGEYDDAEAVKRLFDRGISADAVQQLLPKFQAARDGHKKEPRVHLICQWYSHRLITREEYFDRLRRLGYSDSDAARISEVCHADRVVKERTAAAKAAEAAKREARTNLTELRRQLDEERRRLTEVRRQLAEAEAARAAQAPDQGATPG